MEEWLQLTDEDIERAHHLLRDSPPTPEVITITADDVVAAGDEESDSVALISITEEDLQPAPAQQKPELSMSQLEQLMFHLVNGTRQHHLPGLFGTAQLAWHEDLAATARQHSMDMLKRQYVAHVTPEGITVAQRLQRNGIKYLACGENIGVVYGRAAHSERGVHDIHNAFMSQPRSLTNHRGNLLNPIWTHVGIGVAYNPDGALVVTENFISAPAQRLRES
ncbi:MAG TPA: CAP domain-containing protein [Candidatus Binatia bacterium]|nr:CAP domain-containing protein [Candidatus Binatia bacterium]